MATRKKKTVTSKALKARVAKSVNLGLTGGASGKSGPFKMSPAGVGTTVRQELSSRGEKSPTESRLRGVLQKTNKGLRRKTRDTVAGPIKSTKKKYSPKKRSSKKATAKKR